ncbi:hypothetical protein [Aquimarina rubra]|uniref:DUF4258 domain-containing protein n=1 Tax=Aquimarina rubra TaxID=1920033 RepID=A0ABW5LBC2_9FLAO
MKQYLLFLAILSFGIVYPHGIITKQNFPDTLQNQIDRKLSDEEVERRGLDILAAEVIERIDEIDLRKMARSAIFETSYGFRWKMINLHTGNIIIVKVNKDFKLISARNSKKSKVMTP